jgi:phosphoribosylanthranilate isomerase
MAVLVKVCGLGTPAALDAALAAGADMVGFVFFEASPRHVSLEAASDLAGRVAGRAEKVVLTVDADDASLAAAVAAFRPDLLQLHGRETPERVASVRARFGLPVIKAIGVADAADLDEVGRYEGVADRLLLDAKAPVHATRPGGHGISFDWSLVATARPRRPWLLAGGLTPETVATALAATGAPGLDVSSGVESIVGVKDAGRIAAFVAAARQHEAVVAPRRAGVRR